MDKVASKRAFESAGLPTAAWRCLSRADASARPPLALPVAVKPPDQGSAIGVSIVRSSREWAGALKTGFRYGPTVLVESFLNGPEVTVGILGDKALPTIENVETRGLQARGENATFTLVITFKPDAIKPGALL